MTRIFVGPGESPEIGAAVVRGGATLVTAPTDAQALVWLGHDADELASHLGAHVGWVQLPQAGIERWVGSGVVDDRRVWTSAAGAFGAAVAERVVALLLAGVHRLPEHAGHVRWERTVGGHVDGSRVAIVGTGAIGCEVATRIAALGAVPVGINLSGDPVVGFAEVHPVDRWPALCSEVDPVVLAAPLTDRTSKMLGSAALARLPTHAVVVNVGRGGLVDTDALVEALRSGAIAGAGLDVTAPEPLPPSHPLWREPRALVTSHTANPQPRRTTLLAAHVQENVRRWLAGDDLLGVIDRRRGY